LAGLDQKVIIDGSRLFTEFKGALTEQYVDQQLLAQGYSPVYWSSATGTAETDFAIEKDGALLPIEVRTVENLKSKSLKAACEKFGLSRAVRTSLSPHRDEGWLVNIPLWAIGQIDGLA
jgi:predicted AAA+ superfamily ATPase